MGRRSTFYQKETPKRREVHPVWRGIGCIMMILIPGIGWASARLLLREGPKFGFNDFILTGWISTSGYPLLYVEIGMTIFLSLVLYLLFMFVSFIINQAMGPPRYGSLDAPQESYRGKPYKR